MKCWLLLFCLCFCLVCERSLNYPWRELRAILHNVFCGGVFVWFLSVFLSMWVVYEIAMQCIIKLAIISQQILIFLSYNTIKRAINSNIIGMLYYHWYYYYRNYYLLINMNHSKSKFSSFVVLICLIISQQILFMICVFYCLFIIIQIEKQ